MSDPTKPLIVGGVQRTDEKGEKHVFVLAVQPPAKCEMCGAVEELRPYGPNGEKICFACGQKDPETTNRQFLKVYRAAMGYSE